MKPLVHIATKATNHTPAKIVTWAPSWVRNTER